MINLIKKGFTNLLQYANTSKNVYDYEIYLAYRAAREWIQIVYPEFYNKDQDVFFKKS